MIRSYRDLMVWQKAVDLVPEIYKLLKRFPKEENYALCDQMRRAAVSVAANIAEGHARQHTREFLQQMSIARGSLAELDTLLVVSVRLGYLDETHTADVQTSMAEVGMMVRGITKRLKEKLSSS